jgi:endonuclease IV
VSRTVATIVSSTFAVVQFSFANRNETKHLPYGEGTLRAEPLAAALKKFRRPATVISESPDEESSQAIRSILVGDS